MYIVDDGISGENREKYEKEKKSNGYLENIVSLDRWKIVEIRRDVEKLDARIYERTDEKCLSR